MQCLCQSLFSQSPGGQYRSTIDIGQRVKKGSRKRRNRIRWSYHTTSRPKGCANSCMNSVTQDMKYRQSLIHYAQKHGVSKASRKYNKGRSYIYFWLARYDGSIASLACKSRKPHSHPKAHSEAELKIGHSLRIFGYGKTEKKRNCIAS